MAISNTLKKAAFAAAIWLGITVLSSHAVTIREYDTPDCTGDFEDCDNGIDLCTSYTFFSGDVLAYNLDCPSFGGFFSNHNNAKVSLCYEDTWYVRSRL